MLVTVYNCHNMVYKLAKNYTCMAYKMRKTPIIPTFCIRDATFQYRTLPPQICVRMHQIDSIFQNFLGEDSQTPRLGLVPTALRLAPTALRLAPTALQ